MYTVLVDYFSSSKEDKPSHEISVILCACVCVCVCVCVRTHTRYCSKICASRLVFTNLDAHSSIVFVNFLQSAIKIWRTRERLRPQRHPPLDPQTMNGSRIQRGVQLYYLFSNFCKMTILPPYGYFLWVSV
jgi:hypothetical protein